MTALYDCVNGCRCLREREPVITAQLGRATEATAGSASRGRTVHFCYLRLLCPLPMDTPCSSGTADRPQQPVSEHDLKVINTTLKIINMHAGNHLIENF